MGARALRSSLAMALAVRFPELLSEITEPLAPVFRNEPQRKHFSEYLLGLMASTNKSVTGIRDFHARSNDPSSLNRFLKDDEWDENELNRKRLAWLQQFSDTSYHARGVIAIDNVLVDHSGKRIEEVGYYWDHAEKRHKIAHDLLIAN